MGGERCRAGRGDTGHPWRSSLAPKGTGSPLPGTTAANTPGGAWVMNLLARRARVAWPTAGARRQAGGDPWTGSGCRVPSRNTGHRGPAHQPLAQPRPQAHLACRRCVLTGTVPHPRAHRAGPNAPGAQGRPERPRRGSGAASMRRRHTWGPLNATVPVPFEGLSHGKGPGEAYASPQRTAGARLYR